jgi:hypothetical protein
MENQALSEQMTKAFNRDLVNLTFNLYFAHFQWTVILFLSPESNMHILYTERTKTI